MNVSAHRAALATASVASVGASSVAFAGGRPDAVISGLNAGRAHEAGELIVKFRDGSTAAAQNDVRRGMGAQKIETLGRGKGFKGEIELMRLPAGADLAGAVRVLSANPNVEFAEPNWTYQHTAASNDTYYTNGSL